MIASASCEQKVGTQQSNQLKLSIRNHDILDFYRFSKLNLHLKILTASIGAS